MVSRNAGDASAFTYPKVFKLRLESDIPFARTHTGLPPSPARCHFPNKATVFVNVFVIHHLFLSAIIMRFFIFCQVLGEIKRIVDLARQAIHNLYLIIAAVKLDINQSVRHLKIVEAVIADDAVRNRFHIRII